MISYQSTVTSDQSFSNLCTVIIRQRLVFYARFSKDGLLTFYKIISYSIFMSFLPFMVLNKSAKSAKSVVSVISQNEPNFKPAQNSLTPFLKKTSAFCPRPSASIIKPNSNPIQTQTNPIPKNKRPLMSPTSRKHSIFRRKWRFSSDLGVKTDRIICLTGVKKLVFLSIVNDSISIAFRKRKES